MKHHFCGECGEKLLKLIVEPEKIYIPLPPDGSSYARLASRYNRETGKRQFAYRYRCPNYNKRKWYHIGSPHDEFVDEDSVFQHEE